MLLVDHFRSTPFRIATIYAGLFILSVLILFAVVYWLVTDELKKDLRLAIRQDVGSLLTIYRERGPDGLRMAVKDRIADSSDKMSLYLIRDDRVDLASGEILGPVPIVGWQEITVASDAQSANDDAQESFLANGTRVATSYLVVGRSLHGVEEAQEVLLSSLAWALGLTALLALLGGVGLSRAALSRVNAINRIFNEVMEGHLSRRVPAEGTRDELDHLAKNINAMLDRIELLVQNLQQVTNDVAHDLRTPLGRLRQGLEAARSRESSVDVYQEAVDHAIEQVDTILEIFAALLRIAQIETKTRRGRFAVVDLSEIATRILDAYEMVVDDAGQCLSGTIAPGVYVKGDKELLTQMLANLVENAMRHCPAGTEISISLTGDTTPILAVADTGPGIAAEDRQAVLRRFYRLEKSRTVPGSGLGLALVAAIADLHGATLTLADNLPGLRVVLQFPLRDVH